MKTKRVWLEVAVILTCIAMLDGRANAYTSSNYGGAPTDYCIDGAWVLGHDHALPHNWASTLVSSVSWSSCPGNYVDSEAALWESQVWPPSPNFCQGIARLGGWYVTFDNHASWAGPNLTANYCSVWTGIISTSANMYSSYGVNIIGIGTAWVGMHG